MVLQSGEVDPNSLANTMKYDSDSEPQIGEEEMEVSAANYDTTPSLAFTPKNTSEQTSSKRKSFISDNTTVKSINQEQNAEGRKFIHAKRTSAHNRNDFRTAGQKSITKESMKSEDSAIWTMTCTSDSPMEKNIPEQDNGAIHLPDPNATNCKTPPSAGPSTMLNNDVTAEPQISVNSTSGDITPGAMKAKRDATEAEETHRMERVSAHIPTLDLGELAEKLKKLQIQQARVKRRAQRKKEKELSQKVDVVLGNLSEDELRELFTKQDNDGDNLLMIAIIEGCSALSKALIRLVPSADLLDIRNKLGQTALHLTVITHQWRMVRKLILAGASLTSRDFIGNTPLHVACSNNDLDSVVTLTKTVTCLECPEKAERESLLVPQDSELYNYKGQTCLHIAVQNGFTHLVRYLLETRFHAAVNAPERLCGKTALHIAAELGNLDLVEYLLSKDETNPDAVTYAGHSALDLAEGRGQGRVCKVLEQAGVTAQVTQQNTIEEEEQDEEEEEENDLLTLQDFQCSVIANNSSQEPRQEPLEYDDICVEGKPLQSLQSLR